MNKAAVLEAIVERLQADLALYAKAADSARAEATDEQSKAENKYDTRGLEASYLARGQSRQARETETALEQFAVLLRQPPATPQVIGVGCLVELKIGRDTARYFIGPRAGGTEVTVDGQEILVITSQSPLGKQLTGHGAGERLALDLGGQAKEGRVVSVA